jgi:hypothetical protein
MFPFGGSWGVGGYPDAPSPPWGAMRARVAAAGVTDVDPHATDDDVAALGATTTICDARSMRAAAAAPPESSTRVQAVAVSRSPTAAQSSATRSR